MKTKKIRLHKYLRDYLHEQGNYDYSNPEIARNIGEYGVWLDGVYTQNRLEWVLPGQEIKLDWPLRTHGDFSQVRVLQETDTYLLLYKPPGVVVQPGAGHEQDNLATWLLEYYPGQAEFASEQYPTRGLVHRLDKLTQGLLLVAKDEATLRFFQDQFRAREVEKKYLAIVSGVWTEQVEIKNYQARSQTNPTKNKLFWSATEALEYDLKARFAHSFFRPLFVSREAKRTLVEVKIMTGRMHQIRLQAQALGHALVGDSKYSQMQVSIPKKSIRLDTEFSEGLRRQEALEIHHIDTQEFRQLQESIFGSSQFCLLSNYLSLQAPGGQPLRVQYYDY